jgi:drug/metabolite transporter (DMT)-like permease
LAWAHWPSASFRSCGFSPSSTNGASLATVIQCNAPIIVTILARILWREPLKWQKWGALLLAFVGTALVAQISASGNLRLTPIGLLISLGAAFAYAGITLFTKKLTDDGVDAWTILVYSFAFAALALLPFQFGQPRPSVAGWQAAAAFAGLVLITTIAGYAFYALALRHLQASVASIVALVEVPFAAAFAYFLLGERMNLTQILGAATVLTGVLLLATSAGRRARGPAPAEVR